jgi:hypothetical protein
MRLAWQRRDGARNVSLFLIKNKANISLFDQKI